MLQKAGILLPLRGLVQLLFAAMLILTPLFYNGCPLFYPDSMGYIFWGQLGQPVPERASSYALFIRYFSLGRDLWFPVIFQSLVLSYLLKKIWVRITGNNPDAVYYSVVFLLGLISPLGWTASTLMPDLFCVSSSLFLFLILFPDEGKKPSYWHLGGFVFCGAQHLSNLMINGLLLILFIAFYFTKSKFRPGAFGIRLAFVGIFATYLTIGMVHKLLSGEFFLSKSGPAFLTGRIIETGIANRFLDQNPGKFPEFQRQKAAFPMSLENYLWNSQSPLRNLGGLHDSLDLHKKFNRAVLSVPSNIILFMKAGMKSGVKQLLLLDLGDGLSRGDFRQLFFHPENQAEYLVSRQITGINFEKLNLWNTVFLVLLVVLFIVQSRRIEFGRELLLMGLFILLLCLSNAFVNGSLATPLNRYQVRVFWLVYFWLLAASYPVLKSYFPSNRNTVL